MLNKNRSWLWAVLVIAFCSAYLFKTYPASAAIMFNRSVTISSALPSAVTTEAFEFDIPSSAVLGSIVLQYCANSPSFYAACVAPTGLDVSAASLTSQSGNTGFSIDTADTTASKLVLSRPAIPGIITHNSFNFSNIINPSATSPSTFVRISSYSSTDGSGAYKDNGAVAFAIQNIFVVGAFVPPFLQLCVGITVAPDCSAISGDSIDLGILSSQHANAGQSQFATATNDPNGYTIFALGNTMTSGNNTIQALGTPTPSFPGTPQFGINLRANLLPPIGQDPIGLGTAVPAANYNIPNRFTFIPGDSLTSSPLTTNYNRMTVSYLVNVPAGQPPGVYATTITYVATVQF
jgi:hypothetical protein